MLGVGPHKVPALAPLLSLSLTVPMFQARIPGTEKSCERRKRPPAADLSGPHRHQSLSVLVPMVQRANDAALRG